MDRKSFFDKALVQRLFGNSKRFAAFIKETHEKLRERLNRYRQTDSAKEWLAKNRDLVLRLFEDVSIRNFVFEPFKNVFRARDTTEQQILATITQVSLANAVIAGLPGKLGIGVFVSMALEAYMAFTVAKHVGFRINKLEDVFDYFGPLAITAATIFGGFRLLLNIVFSLLALIPGLPLLTVLSELIVTNIVGLLFWTAFEEARRSGEFKAPKDAMRRLSGRAAKLGRFQKESIKNLNLKNVRLIGERLKSWFSGEMAVSDPTKDLPVIRGEVFSFVAMAALINGKTDQLNGPLGNMFLDSIRRAYSVQLEDASIDEMRVYFESRTPEQRFGDVNLVKGEMFEHLVEQSENTDGDVVVAALHEDRTFPGSDIVFTSLDTGNEVALSLKSVSDPNLIEHALTRYPDIPILTTNEMEQYFGDNPMVEFSDYSDVELEKVTEDNFDRLVQQLPEFNALHVAAGGVAAKAASRLWPFVAAYLRRRITQEQLNHAMTRVLGESGVSLTSRIVWAATLGPVFAWYLLARSVFLITNPFLSDGQDTKETER